MRAKMLLTLLFLLSLGVVAVLFLRAVPQSATVVAQQQAAPPPPKYEVLTTAKPLEAGLFLRAQDVVWHPVAELDLNEIERPSPAVRSTKPEADEEARSSVYGAALRVNLAQGAPVLLSQIVKPGDREFLHVVLTPGTRAMVIPIATGGSGMGLLTPGDRADVILTQTFHDNDTPLTRRSVSETVVESLRVLAIDVGDVKGVIPVNAPVRSVTLEVTPQQAEKINVAIELGKLSLTLRAVGDSGTSVAQEPDNGVKPEWAADVSPALRAASVPVAKPVATDNSVVRVMRGGASETAKPQ